MTKIGVSFNIQRNIYQKYQKHTCGFMTNMTMNFNLCMNFMNVGQTPTRQTPTSENRQLPTPFLDNRQPHF